VSFPILTSPARDLVVRNGYQTFAGFALEERPAIIGLVEPASAVVKMGLLPGDRIINVNDVPIQSSYELRDMVALYRDRDWFKNNSTKKTVDGKEIIEAEVQFTVLRTGNDQPVVLSKTKLVSVDKSSGNLAAMAAGRDDWEQLIGALKRDIPDPPPVKSVDAGSAVATAGLRPGDQIIAVNGHQILTYYQLEGAMQPMGRGMADMELTVQRPGQDQPIVLPKFTPRTMPLYPTQLFETISMVLLFLALTAFYPFRRYYGQVFVMLMVGYAFHRFFNETLRNDTDPVLWRLTLSQVGSILVLSAAVVLHFILRKYSPLESTTAKPAAIPAQTPMPVTP
jgi:hypothetical protein